MTFDENLFIIIVSIGDFYFVCPVIFLWARILAYFPVATMWFYLCILYLIRNSNYLKLHSISYYTIWELFAWSGNFDRGLSWMQELFELCGPTEDIEVSYVDEISVYQNLDEH